jgi:hypothetical protein
MFHAPAVIVRLALAVVGAAACSAPDLPGDRVWESGHVRYHVRGDDHGPCEAVAARIDRNFEVLRAALGFRWEPGWMVDYYKFRDRDDRDEHSGCPRGYNCGWGQHVESDRLFDEHELVHAYLADTAVPPMMFVEGLAHALSCRATRTAYNRASLPELLTWKLEGNSLGGPDRYYDTAAWFVGHLWRTYGAEQFMRLYREIPRGSDHAVVSKSFVDVLGVTLDRVWQEAFAVLDPQVACIPLWACAQDPLPVDGTTTELGPTCTADWEARTFELPRDASLKVDYDGRLAFPGSCGGGRAPLLVDGGAHPAVSFVELSAGRYYLSRDGTTYERIALSTLPSPLSGPSCAALAPLDLGELRKRLSIAVPEARLPAAVRLRSARARDARFAFDFRDNRSLRTPVDAALCAGCGEEEASCRPVPGPEGLESTSGDQVLLLRSAEPSPDGFLTITVDLR